MQSLNNTQLNKINSYIGFSVKSGKAIFGLEMLKRAKIKPFLILIDENLGSNSLKQTKLYSERNNVKIITLPNNHLNNYLKRNNVKVLSLLDESLCNAIMNIVQ